MATKEIIGYNLLKKEYEEPAVKIIHNDRIGQFNNPKTFIDLDDNQEDCLFQKNSFSFNSLKRAGVLDLWFTPVYKEEPELNKWYKDKNVSGKDIIFFANEIFEDGDVLGYGIAGDEDWCQCGIWGEADRFEGAPVTDKEIEAALIKEAKNRGFKEGIKYISINNSIVNADYGCFIYSGSTNSLYFMGGMIFKNGQWAEIIEQPEYKVGDIVVGWHNEINENIHNTPWKIGRLMDEYVYPDGYDDWNTGLDNIRHATPEEIQVYNTRQFEIIIPAALKDQITITYK